MLEKGVDEYSKKILTRKFQLINVWNQTSKIHSKNATTICSTKKSQSVDLVAKWSFLSQKNAFVFKMCKMLKSQITSCHRKPATFSIQQLQIILLQIITLIKPKCFIYEKHNIIIWNGYNNVQNSTLILIYSESSSRSQKKFLMNSTLKNIWSPF